jgi:hypothetical protein
VTSCLSETASWILNILLDFKFSQCHNMYVMEFVVSPPGCGRSVIDFLVWDANEGQLAFRDEVDNDI